MVSRALTSARRGVSVVTIGLSIFLASVPLGITGLCDPKPARGSAVLTAAVEGRVILAHFMAADARV
jgi:hypothetical protein